MVRRRHYLTMVMAPYRFSYLVSPVHGDSTNRLSSSRERNETIESLLCNISTKFVFVQIHFLADADIRTGGRAE